MSKIAISGASTGTATFTIESPATSTNRTLTLPDNTGTIVTTGTTTGISASAISTGTLAAARLPAGTILNVWTDVLTTGESLSVNDGTTNSGAAWTDSSLDLTVTPTNSNAKFLVFADIKYQATFNVVYRIYDVTGSTVILGSVGTGGSNQQKVSGGPFGSAGAPSGGNAFGTDSRTSVVFYTPASSSATRQFKVQFLGANDSGTTYVGRNPANSNNLFDTYSPCTLTVLEVAV
jgi:hypothetical protein